MKYAKLCLLSGLLLAVLVPASPVHADECADLAAYQGGGTGATYADWPGYDCDSQLVNVVLETFDDKKTKLKQWDVVGVPHCGCGTGDATFGISKTHTDKNTGTKNVSGSYGLSSSVTAGGTVPGLAKFEAKAEAEWNIGAGATWGEAETAASTQYAETGFEITRCSGWSYKKYFWKAEINDTEDLHVEWYCPINSPPWMAAGETTITHAVEGYGLGVGPTIMDVDEYEEKKIGYQEWDVRCVSCVTDGHCYKATEGCSDLCPCPTPEQP